jgi:hypothetical protein
MQKVLICVCVANLLQYSSQHKSDLVLILNDSLIVRYTLQVPNFTL